MVKCSKCGKNYSFFHYINNGKSKPFVKYPTCKECFKKAKKE
jgi:NAD-dependent SIR2 family protein deacetylase